MFVEIQGFYFVTLLHIDITTTFPHPPFYVLYLSTYTYEIIRIVSRPRSFNLLYNIYLLYISKYYVSERMGCKIRRRIAKKIEKLSNQ